jgi:hypothetical protein
MRELTDKEKLQKFMRAIGARAPREVRLYFTGGSTAVLMGWRPTTIDVDIRFLPETDELFRALPPLKEELQMNIELACPADFIPPLPGWKERCVFIGREGNVSFYHYDLYAQALAKIERGHAQDRQDVEAMIQRGLVERGKLLQLYAAIKPHLYRYPAIDPKSFSRAVQDALKNKKLS